MEGTINVAPGDSLQSRKPGGEWKHINDINTEEDLSAARAMLRARGKTEYRIFRKDWDRRDRVGSERSQMPITQEMVQRGDWWIYWDPGTENIPYNVR